jgi:hypothetical protein
MIGTLETELWRLKGCEIFYDFVMFSFRAIEAVGFKCKFCVSSHSVPFIDGSEFHWKGDSTTLRFKQYKLDWYFGPSIVMLHKTQSMTDWQGHKQDWLILSVTGSLKSIRVRSAFSFTGSDFVYKRTIIKYFLRIRIMLNWLLFRIIGGWVQVAWVTSNH